MAKISLYFRDFFVLEEQFIFFVIVKILIVYTDLRNLRGMANVSEHSNYK